jgi:hypothetical protein
MELKNIKLHKISLADYDMGVTLGTGKLQVNFKGLSEELEWQRTRKGIT